MKLLKLQRRYVVSGLVAVLNVFSNLIASLIATGGWSLIIIFTVAGVIAAVVYFFARPQLVEVVFRSPKTLRTPADCQAAAHKGLILTLGLYKPNAGSPAAALTPQQRRQAAKDLDYAALDLPNSSFAPAIEAVESHLNRLEQCWLITAVSSQNRAALEYLPVLIAYLQKKKKAACGFHAGENFSVPLDDDALVTEKTRDLVNRIFADGRAKYKLLDTEIICDFSGGIRSLSLGMILACLDGKRKVEYICTGYDKEGNFTGDKFPMVLDYEPRLLDQ